MGLSSIHAFYGTVLSIPNSIIISVKSDKYRNVYCATRMSNYLVCVSLANYYRIIVSTSITELPSNFYYLLILLNGLILQGMFQHSIFPSFLPTKLIFVCLNTLIIRICRRNFISVFVYSFLYFEFLYYLSCI